MGSVKDLEVIRPPYENQAGLGNFVFSDRYSVFDWGEMPDHIAGKGSSLALMAAYHFEELERRGIRTHYQGLVSRSGKLVRLEDLKEGQEGTALMQVALARVYHPIAREFWTQGHGLEASYDYSFFECNRGGINNYLLGLEVIVRSGLPLGSSVFKKIKQAKSEADPKLGQKRLNQILKSLGLKEEPQPGQLLPRPVISYTTKLEPGDRTLSQQEAYRISGLKPGQFRKVEYLGLEVNALVNGLAEKAEFTHYDGKIELVYHQGLVVCDVLGTFDEDRFTFAGEQISKEVIRQWYKKNQPEFVSACERWKATGPGWQERCEVKPKHLPKDFATLVSQMYKAGSNRYVGKRIFRVPKLEQVIERLRSYR